MINLCKTLRLSLAIALPVALSHADSLTLSNATLAENQPAGTVVGVLSYYGTGGGIPLLSVAAGEGHNLAVRQNGSLWVWGSNESGQLGDASFTSSAEPQEVIFSGVSKVAAGKSHSLFIKTDGSLWAMGSNAFGQLGDGTTTNRNQPVKVKNSGVTAVAAGDNHSLFLLSDGSLWAMGNNESGQFGNSTTTSSMTPEMVIASDVTAIGAGANHTLFVMSNGSLWAMGGNQFGQLGIGTLSQATTPRRILNSDAVSVDAGNGHSLFVKSDGSLWGMGKNTLGQLGTGNTSNSAIPIQSIASGVINASAGNGHSLVLQTDGTLWGMGNNFYGQLGLGTSGGDAAAFDSSVDKSAPVQITGPGISHISAGAGDAAFDSLYATTGGSILATGHNPYALDIGDSPRAIEILTSATFTLVSGTGSQDNAKYTVNGTKLLTSSPFDFETQSSHTVRIRATDAASQTFEQSFTIMVTDMADSNAPTNITLSNASVNENQATGTLVGTLSGTDPDQGDILTFSLTSYAQKPDNAAFSISGTQLLTTKSFDYETQAAYEVGIRATDQGGLTFDKTFTINISDIAENNPPSNITLSNTTLAENLPAGTLVGILSASDPDVGDIHTYALTPTAQTPGKSFFSLAGNQLFSTKSFDYETQAAYEVGIRATDQGGLTFDKTFTINISDIAENNPPANITLSNNTVAESLPSSTLVGILSASDPDPSDSLFFSLTDPTQISGNSSFFINGFELRTSRPLDYETQPTYTIQVRATDSRGLSTDRVFTILVLEKPESLPPSDITLDKASIPENQPSGTLVGNLSATDPDGGGTHTFSLPASLTYPDNNAFIIRGNQLLSGQSYDYEIKNTYSIRIGVTDPQGLQFDKEFSILITNIPENNVPTNITLSNATINENQPAGTLVGQLSVGGLPANYSLVTGVGSSNNDIFSISGQNLVADISFDYESQSVYSIRVQAHNPANPAWTVPLQKVLNITIQDILETPTSQTGTLTLSPGIVEENKPVGTLVGRFSFGGTPIKTTFTSKTVAGVGHSLVLKQDGSLWTMGSNTNGQLGNGTTTSSTIPQQILSSGVVDIAAGGWHSLFLKQDGSLWAMGRNRFGQLGTGSTADELAPFPIVDTGVIAISAGAFHSIFLKSDGSLWSMGDNQLGQLGDGTFTQRNSPTQVESSGVTLIAAGGYFSMYVKTGGSLWTVGDNSSGQMGDGTFVTNAVPKQILHSGVKAIAAGGYHGLFIKDDNSLWGIGDNNVGQLGSVTSPAVGTPRQIFTSGIVGIAGGDSHSLVLKSDGSLWAMGNNALGQLGDGTKVSRSVPVEIVDSGVTGLSAGDEYSFYILQDGSFWATGKNDKGQLGLGTTTTEGQSTPVEFAQGSQAANSGSFLLVPGTGSTDNLRYYIVGDQLFTNQAFNYEEKSAYNIRVMGTDTSGNTEEKAFVVNIIDLQEFGTTDKIVSGGWRIGPWFGSYYPSPSNPSWVFHSSLGWVFIPQDQPENDMWIYHPQHGWFWTGSLVYPHLYSGSSGYNTWLYLDESSAPAEIYQYINTNWTSL